MPIQAAGTRPPLFCVHAGGAHVLFYRHLAKRLGPDQPVFGLQPLGLEEDQPRLVTIEQMATHYVDELRSIQPNGPYHLAGYCIGGTVCLEMARELERRGQQVTLLAVLDSGFYWLPKPPTTTTGKVKKVAKRDGLLYLFRLTNRKIRREVSRWWRLKYGNPASRRQVRLKLVEEACKRAFRTYSPNPCNAPVTLIRTSEYVNLEEKDRHLKWQTLTPNLKVHVVPGEHQTMLLEPGVEHVARIMSACLEPLPADRHHTDAKPDRPADLKDPSTRSVEPSA